MTGKATTIDFTRMLKRCARCRVYQSLDAFPASTNAAKAGFHRRQAYCFPCGWQLNAEWRQRNRPRKDGKPATAGRYATRSAEQKRLDRNATQRAYAKANASRVLWWNRLRQQRQRAGGPMPHHYDIGGMCCEQEHLCVYCRALLPERFHIDHKTPVSRGGANATENLQLLCGTCNLQKGRKTHEEYLQILGRSA